MESSYKFLRIKLSFACPCESNNCVSHCSSLDTEEPFFGSRKYIHIEQGIFRELTHQIIIHITIIRRCNMFSFGLISSMPMHVKINP